MSHFRPIEPFIEELAEKLCRSLMIQFVEAMQKSCLVAWNSFG